MAKILVIDDSATVIRSVEAALVADGHVIESLTRFVELPSRIRQQPPDLILLDLEIPALSGVALGRYVRKYQTRPIPILIHSSRPEPELIQAALEVAATGFVVKGATPDHLRSEVNRALTVSLELA